MGTVGIILGGIASAGSFHSAFSSSTFMLLELAFLIVKDGSPLASPSCPADVMGADAGGCQESEGKGEAGSGNPAAPATGASGPGSDFQNPHPNYGVKPRLSE
ncbi:uncharacterized protein LOC108292994 [Cebus imitator]|uniref:uncharacterized protein LOC108292994 n=1 Tax=Cebus imitator TaxID=2715852 RepID=UPI000809B6EE|nr:uncharacterized protein LOC108292994 [Cebus imitator]